MKKTTTITGGLILLLLLTGAVLYFVVPPKKQKIAIVPLGKVDSVYVKAATEALSSFYQAEVTELDSLSLPVSSYYSPRNRYRADSLLIFLKLQKSRKYDKIVGITEVDISAASGEHKDWGIMGLAFQPGKSAVISTFRIKKGAESIDHVLERFQKVVLHETGHTFGLPHCKNSNRCLMRSADGKVSTLDAEKMEVCSNCNAKLSKTIYSY